jgi:polysaccharide pyruvyl transferase WcaK-like protein
MQKKILFTGYYGFDNYGDDLFGVACAHSIKKMCENYSAVILGPPIDGVNAQYLVPIALRRAYQSQKILGKALRMLFMLYGCIRYRNIVLAGGSVITSGSSYRMRRFQFFLAKLKLCKISAIGVSVGPFHTAKDAANARSFINALDYLCVRDQASFVECSRLSITKKFKLYNDLAGCAPLEEAYKNQIAHRPTLGVSLCNYESIVGGNSSAEAARNDAMIQGIAEFALNREIHVKVIVLNSNKHVGDMGLSNRLYEYLKSSNISTSLVGYTNPVSTMKDIAACDIFFSVRLHGAITAYLLRIPFILVKYHKKCTDFLEHIGAPSHCGIESDVYCRKEVADALAQLYAGAARCELDPGDYIEHSKKIFLESPWSCVR